MKHAMTDRYELPCEVFVYLVELLSGAGIGVKLASCEARGSNCGAGEPSPYQATAYCLAMGGTLFDYSGAVQSDAIAERAAQMVLDEYEHAKVDTGETSIHWDEDAQYPGPIYLDAQSRLLIEHLSSAAIAQFEGERLQHRVEPALRGGRTGTRL